MFLISSHRLLTFTSQFCFGCLCYRHRITNAAAQLVSLNDISGQEVCQSIICEKRSKPQVIIDLMASKDLFFKLYYIIKLAKF